jgi:hypothetical protein
VPNPVFVFLRKLFLFKRRDPNLMVKKEPKQPIDFFLLEEGKTKQPHNFLY